MVLGNRQSQAQVKSLLEVLADPGLWAGLAPLGVLVLLLLVCVVAG